MAKQEQLTAIFKQNKGVVSKSVDSEVTALMNQISDKVNSSHFLIQKDSLALNDIKVTLADLLTKFGLS